MFFCADNTNKNFCEVQRRGQCKVFYKLNSVLNREIEGVDCSAADTLAINCAVNFKSLSIGDLKLFVNL